jgi:hypothetical protein
MDKRLEERLSRWLTQIEEVHAKELAWRKLDASEKSLLAELTLKAEGKSHAERETRALASQSWKDFSQGLAIAESEFNHAKRLLELKAKAYDAEHVTYKIENEAVKRG